MHVRSLDDSRIAKIKQLLNGALPSMAAEWVASTTDMSVVANQSFARNPDDPLEHTPRWHQYGILTHSIEFDKALRTSIPQFTDRWSLTDPVHGTLAGEIDGATKGQLLEIAALLHDVGKFSTRKAVHDDRGATFSFPHHEKASGVLIRGGLRPTLEDLGLTDRHIEYVAACAELHFELGKVRRASKLASGYTIAFTESPAFTTAAREIMDAHPDFALEIGLEFLADSLAKTSVFATAQTDDDIAAQRPALETELAEHGLPAQLINQALQHPVNVKVAELYLREWAQRSD